MSSRKQISNTFTVTTVDDPVSVQAQYAPNSNPSAGQIHTVWQSGDLYMRTRESDSSVWSSWHKIVGESGDETNFSFGISSQKTTANAQTAPSDISSWSDAPVAVTSAKPYLWAKVQKKAWNETKQDYDVTSTSYIRLTGEDGYTVQAQYAPTNNPTSAQIHTTWQDGDLYMRTKQSNETSWSSWHKIVGESGDETNFSFGISSQKTTANAQTAPSDISSWSDAPVAVTSAKPYLWAKVQKKAWNETKQDYDVTSTSYIRLTGEDGYTVQAQYAPTNNPTSQQIHTTWQDGDLYMRTKQSNETSWSSWHKIVGESGDETNFSFGISSQKTTNNAQTAPSDISSWSDAPVAVTSAKPYLWAKVQKKAWNETKQDYDVTSTSYIRLTGDKGDTGSAGATGPQGKIGRFYYYAQAWSNDSTISYQVTDTEAPYFSYNNKYWIFNPTANGTYTMSSMGTPSSSDADWKLMVTDFKYLITEAIFGAYAHFGSFIINGDWMISEYGRIGDTLYNRDNSAKRGNDKAYLYFDPAYPLGTRDLDITANAISGTTRTQYGTSFSLQYKRVIRVKGYVLSGSTMNIALYTTAGSVISTVFTVTSTSPVAIEIPFSSDNSTQCCIKAWMSDSSSAHRGFITSVTVETFVPTFAIDGLTGNGYMQTGYFRGGTRSPFAFISDTNGFDSGLSDNVALYSTTTGFTNETVYNLPWDAMQSGRRVVITNYKWKNTTSPTEGYIKMTAPTGKYFFEDGKQKSTLKMSREAVELLGYGDGSDFYGWIVMQRVDLVTEHDYGHPQAVLAKGIVTGGTSPTLRGTTYFGTKPTVSRSEQGKYVLSGFGMTFASLNDVFVIATGIGSVNGNPVCANFASTANNQIEIDTFTSAGFVDASFSFMIMNLKDVEHLVV